MFIPEKEFDNIYQQRIALGKTAYPAFMSQFFALVHDYEDAMWVLECMKTDTTELFDALNISSIDD